VCCAPLWRNFRSLTETRRCLAVNGKNKSQQQLKVRELFHTLREHRGKTRSEATTLKIYQQLLHSETNEPLSAAFEWEFLRVVDGKTSATFPSFLTKSLLLPLFRQLPVTSWLGFFSPLCGSVDAKSIEWNSPTIHTR
jgi:hypothetical protein